MIDQRVGRSNLRVNPARAGVLAALVCGLGGWAPLSASAEVLANWTFETSVPATFGPHVAEAGVFAAQSTGVLSHRDVLSVVTSPAGNGSTRSFSSNWWLENDAYLFYAPTTGYDTITIAFDQTRSSTGPSSFGLQVSLNGVDWTDVASYTVQQVTWSSGTPQASSVFGPYAMPALANDQPTVVIRMISIAAGSTTAGTNRMDNVVISGTLVPVPGGAAAMLAVCVLGAGRRRHG